MTQHPELPVRSRQQPQQQPTAPTRREIEALPRQTLHFGRNSTKADVYLVEWPPGSGEKAVWKDMKQRPMWFRLFAGRHFLSREWRSLKALEGIEGIPGALARPDADSLLLEWRPGTPMLEFDNGQVSADAVETVERIVAQAHARGVVHGDLHRSNVLLFGPGEITILDWATSGRFGTRRSALKNFTFLEWCALDRRAIAKLKMRHAPDRLSEAEKKALINPSALYMAVRGAGFRVRQLLGRKVKSPALLASRYRKILEPTTQTDANLSSRKSRPTAKPAQVDDKAQ